MTITPRLRLLGRLRAIARRELDKDVIHIYERRNTGSGTSSDQFDALCGGGPAQAIEELRPGILYCRACLDRRLDDD